MTKTPRIRNDCQYLVKGCDVLAILEFLPLGESELRERLQKARRVISPLVWTNNDVESRLEELEHEEDDNQLVLTEKTGMSWSELTDAIIDGIDDESEYEFGAESINSAVEDAVDRMLETLTNR